MSRVELSQMIIDLRRALERAQDEGEGKSIRILINETELELDVAVQAEGEAGIKFYVVNAGGGASSQESQKTRIKLLPVSKVDGAYKKVTIADEDTR